MENILKYPELYDVDEANEGDLDLPSKVKDETLNLDPRKSESTFSQKNISQIAESVLFVFKQIRLGIRSFNR